MNAPSFKCVSSSGEVRYFDRFKAAYRFVMREGDKSRLWSLDRMAYQRTAAEYRARAFAYLDQCARLRNRNMSLDLVRSYGRGLRRAAGEAGFYLP